MQVWRKEMMTPVTRCGLIAGAISGEIMVLIVPINIILIRNYSGTGTASAGIPLIGIWNVAYPLLVIIVFEMGESSRAGCVADRPKARKIPSLPG